MSVDTVAPDTRHESVGMLLSNMINNKNENAYYFIRLVKTNLLVVLYVGKYIREIKQVGFFQVLKTPVCWDELTSKHPSSFFTGRLCFAIPYTHADERYYLPDHKHCAPVNRARATMAPYLATTFFGDTLCCGKALNSEERFGGLFLARHGWYSNSDLPGELRWNCVNDQLNIG